MAQTDSGVKLPREVGQVAVVVRDLDRAIDYYTGLGLGPFRRWEATLPQATFRGRRLSLHLKLALARLGPLQLELIEAQEGENLYWEFLQERGEGLHHLGFNVPDLEAEVARFARQGIGVLQSGKTDGVSFAYLDTAGIGGVIFELIQRG